MGSWRERVQRDFEERDAERKREKGKENLLGKAIEKSEI